MKSGARDPAKEWAENLPMDTNNDCGEPVEARRFAHGDGWEVRVYLTGHGSGSVAGHAEVDRHGEYKCRIVLAGTAADEETAIDALAVKALNWIDDWHRRDHSGSTGFADI
jgi:hypothetical protein